MSGVMTFYRFSEMTGLDEMRDALERRGAALGLKGTLLIATEGINGTLTGPLAALETCAEILRALPGCADMPVKFSTAHPDNPVFHRLKVRIRPEIVALGRPEVRPAVRTGTPVDASTWNRLLDDPEVKVIDTRNRYEIAIGTFPGATDPGTQSFREFPDYVENLDPEIQPRVAMFCTGGIRCEKASAFMLQQGFEAVYQLDGGILKYLETVEPEENRWEGECFVFDHRVSVNSELKEGSYQQCFACRRALAPVDLESPHYQPGVSCGYCHATRAPAAREALLERQRQVELAAARGDIHVGKTMPEPSAKR